MTRDNDPPPASTIIVDGRRWALEKKRFPLAQSIRGGSHAAIIETGPPTEMGHVPKWIRLLPVRKDGAIANREAFWGRYEKWVVVGEIAISVPTIEVTTDGKVHPRETAFSIITLLFIFVCAGLPLLWTIFYVLRTLFR